MDGRCFNMQLDRLREGKLILTLPGESGLTAYASTSLYELRSYVAALEAGYRAQTARLEAYRGQARGKTLGQVVNNQWSKPAALGYAAAALRQSGQNPSQVVGVLELMEELMDEHPRAWAEEIYQSMLDDPGGDEGTDHSASPQHDRTEDAEC